MKKMAQRKGQTGNPKGRPKGTPNKVTKELRQIIKEFLDHNAKTLQKNFEKLTPENQLLFFEKMLKYALPIRSEQRINFDAMSDEMLDDFISKINI